MHTHDPDRSLPNDPQPSHIPLTEWLRLRLACSDETAARANAEIAKRAYQDALAQVEALDKARAALATSLFQRYGVGAEDVVNDDGDNGGLIVRKPAQDGIGGAATPAN